MNFSEIQLGVLAPLGLLGLGILVLVLVDALMAERETEVGVDGGGIAKGAMLAAIAGVILVAAIVSARRNIFRAGSGVEVANAMIVVDDLASLAFLLIGLSALIGVLLAYTYLSTLRSHHGEYYALMLTSTLGAFVVAASGNFVILFLGLELMALPVYVLAGFDRDRLLSNEAGLKAHMIGILSSAVSLYGIALLYGATGHLDYRGIGEVYTGQNVLASAGLGLVAVGLLTRVHAVPFHQWLPDVSEGAPATVSAFLSTTLVAAGFVALIRIWVEVLGEAPEVFGTALDAIAIASMLLGALLALVQSNVKRMLAYAGISHAGFMLVGLSTSTPASRAGSIFYLFAFVFMQLGAYASIVALARGGREHEHLSDYAGMAERRPILAAATTLFLFALAGLPGTSGFMGRFNLMSAALEADRVGLALMMALTSVALFATYFRIPTAIYMGQGHTSDPGLTPGAAVVALAICASMTLYLGIFPGAGPLAANILELVRSSTP